MSQSKEKEAESRPKHLCLEPGNSVRLRLVSLHKGTRKPGNLSPILGPRTRSMKKPFAEVQEAGCKQEKGYSEDVINTSGLLLFDVYKYVERN